MASDLIVADEVRKVEGKALVKGEVKRKAVRFYLQRG